VDWGLVKKEIRDHMKSAKEPVSNLAKKISKKYGLPKNSVYQEALKIRSQKSEDGLQRTDDRGRRAEDRGQRA
jgi:hypothetical protein